MNMTNDEGNPVVSSDGEVTIIPRVDSYYNYLSGYQGGYLRFDASLQLGLYSYEWNFVLSHRNEARLVLIYSWDEFHEKTAVEPYIDGSSSSPADYLLNMTSRFIDMLETPSG